MRISMLTLAASLAISTLCARPALAQSHATDTQLAAQLLDLEQRRADANLRGPIIVSAIGAGFFGTGAVLAIDAVIFNADVCTEDSGVTATCVDRQLVRGYAIAGGVSMAIGVPLLAAGLPWLFRRLRTRRELGRRIHELRGPVALRSFDVQLAPGWAGARASFVF